ncbi:UNVERIFIED_CONTAM: hypothetical protein HDU68_001080 [Siphonaria sp. JEL0065]|nr:hypothetical protein HDU68_001080 [Siphonaria sp. JEL0065]
MADIFINNESPTPPTSSTSNPDIAITETEADITTTTTGKKPLRSKSTGFSSIQSFRKPRRLSSPIESNATLAQQKSQEEIQMSPLDIGTNSVPAIATSIPSIKTNSNKKEKSSDSLLSNVSSTASLMSQKSSGKLDEIFVSQPMLHRTGWDLYGKVEDEEDSPMRKLAGLKLKYRYPIPVDLNSNQHSGFVVVRQWSLAAVEMKWKKRFTVIKDNKAYLLKGPTDKNATAIIKLDDCIINPAEYSLYAHSFWLTPPPGAMNETNDGKEFMWIIIAPSEELKVEWIAAFMKAAAWREQQITESGMVPTITVHHPESPTINAGNSPLASSSASAKSASDTSEPALVSPAPSPMTITPISGSTQTSPATSNFPSSVASPELRSVKSSPSLQSPVIDTIFPFPIPDLATLGPSLADDSSKDNNCGASNSKSKLETNQALQLMCASNARFFKNGGFKSASSLIKSAERRTSKEWAKLGQIAEAKKAAVEAKNVEANAKKQGGGGEKSPPRRSTSPVVRSKKDFEKKASSSASSVASSSSKRSTSRRQTYDGSEPNVSERRAGSSMGSIH